MNKNELKFCIHLSTMISGDVYSDADELNYSHLSNDDCRCDVLGQTISNRRASSIISAPWIIWLTKL